MRFQFVVPTLIVGTLVLLYCAFTMMITWGEGHLIQPIIAVAFTGTLGGQGKTGHLSTLQNRPFQ